MLHLIFLLPFDWFDLPTDVFTGCSIWGQLLNNLVDMFQRGCNRPESQTIKQIDINRLFLSFSHRILLGSTWRNWQYSADVFNIVLICSSSIRITKYIFDIATMNVFFQKADMAPSNTKKRKNFVPLPMILSSQYNLILEVHKHTHIHLNCLYTHWCGKKRLNVSHRSTTTKLNYSARDNTR